MNKKQYANIFIVMYCEKVNFVPRFDSTCEEKCGTSRKLHKLTLTAMDSLKVRNKIFVVIPDSSTEEIRKTAKACKQTLQAFIISWQKQKNRLPKEIH